jgi:hypothetical protein
MRTHLHIMTCPIPLSKPEAAWVRPKMAIKFCNEWRGMARSVNWDPVWRRVGLGVGRGRDGLAGMNRCMIGEIRWDTWHG